MIRIISLWCTGPGQGELWRQGRNTVSPVSANPAENLRPPVFFDSLLVPGVAADEYVNLTESERLVQPTKRDKSAIQEPDYDVSIMALAKGPDKLLYTHRVVHINRINLLPYAQDIYSEKGHIVTSAAYDGYKDFDGLQFPTKITISRPLDELVLTLQISSVKFNEALTDDQFQLDVPENVSVRQMR